MMQSAKRRKVCYSRSEELKTNVEAAAICSNDRKEKNKADDRNYSSKLTNDANASKKNYDSDKKEPESKAIVKMAFQIDDAVWVKIRGHPTWPAKIEKFHYGRTLMVDVFWFNDYRRTKVFGSQLQNFLLNLQTYKHTFQNHIGLETAVKEAMIYLTSKSNF